MLEKVLERLAVAIEEQNKLLYKRIDTKLEAAAAIITKEYNRQAQQPTASTAADIILNEDKKATKELEQELVAEKKTLETATKKKARENVKKESKANNDASIKITMEQIRNLMKSKIEGGVTRADLKALLTDMKYESLDKVAQKDYKTLYDKVAAL